MKKLIFTTLCCAVLLSSCGSYEAAGAYTGSQFGNVLGSAIGGLAGGWRGHEIGSIIGTVGGAAVGAAIGKAQDKKVERRYEEQAMSRRRQSTGTTRAPQRNDSGYDPDMRGDDRITFGTDSYSASGLSLRHAAIMEEQRDGVLRRGETCRVVFEIVNNSDKPAYDVFPLVEEVTGNKHVSISPNLRIESIEPHKAIRYTATLRADQRLRNGRIMVSVGVAQGNTLIESQTQQFDVPTAK